MRKIVPAKVAEKYIPQRVRTLRELYPQPAETIPACRGKGSAASGNGFRTLRKPQRAGKVHSLGSFLSTYLFFNHVLTMYKLLFLCCIRFYEP